MRLITIALSLLLAAGAQAQQPFDVLIVNGKVYDGSGNPWFYSDIGIRESRVVALGKLAGRLRSV